MTASVIQPPGSPFDARWYVSRPREEELARRYLSFGKPVLVWGPREHGRTWFARHVVAEWQRAEAEASRSVTINFQTFGEGAFASLDDLLGEVVAQVAEALSEDTGEDPEAVVHAWWTEKHGAGKTRVNGFLARWALPAVAGAGGDGRLLLFLNHADLVLRCPFYNDFAGLLRSWAEKGADGPPWSRLRLLVAVSTWPARLSTEEHQSPFANLCEPILLGDLGAAQVAQMAQLHGLTWAAADVERLMALVGGHPYLVRLALSDIVDGHCTLDRLAAGETPQQGLLADYLHRARSRLDADPALAAAFAALREDPAAVVPPAVADQLIRQGLVTRGPGGTHPVRYRLFERIAVADVATGPRKLRLFVSYSHRDDELRQRLEVHLKLLVRMGLIETWTDRCIDPGTAWAAAIDRELERAHVILLLVSADFLASDYCWDKELKRALERHDKGEAVVVPIIVRPVDFAGAPFASLQALPKDARPVTRWTDPEDAWVDVSQRLRKIIEARLQN